MNVATEHALSASMISELRLADRIVFRHANGFTAMEAVTESKGNEVARFIIRTGVKFTQYGKDKLDEPESNALCVASLASRYDGPVHTFLKMLKANDVITLVWVRDNNNGLLEKAGLHQDELRAYVHRPGKAKRERYEFLLDVSVTLDNTARMIRRGY